MSGRRTADRLTPKRLILDLLHAGRGRPLTARETVMACGLFGIPENTARVALARLLSDRWIATSDRGSYVLADRAHLLADEVATWRTANRRVRKWSEGQYVGVMTGAARSKKSNGGRREQDRALDMLGFRQAQAGLHVRPDNLEADLGLLGQRLQRLGLPSAATVFRISSLSEPAERAFRGLWDTAQLSRRYRYWIEKLDRWMVRSQTMVADKAARDAFLIGGDAIRHVVYDPLLPEPMVDVRQRDLFFSTVQKVDDHGKRIWRSYYRVLDQQVPAPKIRARQERLSVRTMLAEG